jgi:hypothetical protein
MSHRSGLYVCVILIVVSAAVGVKQFYLNNYYVGGDIILIMCSCKLLALVG